MVDQCLEKGIKSFFYHISPNDIARDHFIKLKMCFKCYQIEDHITQNCPKNTDYVICSECSSHEHKFDQCNSGQNKKCVNCHGAHSTLALGCPTRKNMLQQKRKRVTSSSYSDVTLRQNGTNENQLVKIYDQIILSNMCIITAAMKEQETPGCYGDVLTSLLKVNKLPEFKMGDISPPKLFTSNTTPVGGTTTPVGGFTMGGANNASTSSESTATSSVQTVVGNVPQHPINGITIWKRDDVQNVHARNVKQLAQNGRIILESNSDSSELKLIEMLLKIPAKEFPKVNALTTEQFIVKLCEIKRKSVQSS